MNLTKEQKELLHDAWNFCDREGKSTAFTIEHMMTVASTDYDSVEMFIRTTSFIDRLRRVDRGNTSRISCDCINPNYLPHPTKPITSVCQNCGMEIRST